MRSTFNGGNRGRNVIFPPPTSEKTFGRHQRQSGDGEDLKKMDTDEPRTVKLLPDANMTISVHNDFRDISSPRNSGNSGNSGNSKNLKSFRDEMNFNFNNDRNYQNSNRNFESYIPRGRGRGRPRGFSHGLSNNQEYVNNQDNKSRYRNEQQDDHYDGRQTSNNYNQRYNNTSQDHQYPQSTPKSYPFRKSYSNYEMENENKPTEKFDNNFRGYRKHNFDHSRKSRGESHGRSFNEKEEKRNENLIEIISHPNHLYENINQTVTSQNKEQIIYKAQNFIPNKLKTNEAKRKFIIQQIKEERAFVLTNLISDNSSLDLHVVSGTRNMIMQNVNKTFFKSVILQPRCSYKISKALLSMSNITISSNKSSIIIALEIYEPTEKHIPKEIEQIEKYSYNPTYNDMKLRYSFIRKKLSLKEVRQRLLFIDAEFVRTEENKRVPVAVSILNFYGETTLNTLAYPRPYIKYYDSHCHGLTENKLLGKMDSEDLKHHVQQLVKNKILVGSDLHEDLRSLGIQPYSLCGIRDLANSINIREEMEDEKPLMKLKDIASFVLGEEIQKKYHSSKEDATAVFKIYKKIENEWLDHKGCLVSDEIELCEKCEETHLKSYGRCCEKRGVLTEDAGYYSQLSSESEPKTKRPKISLFNTKVLYESIHFRTFGRTKRGLSFR